VPCAGRRPYKGTEKLAKPNHLYIGPCVTASGEKYKFGQKIPIVGGFEDDAAISVVRNLDWARL